MRWGTSLHDELDSEMRWRWGMYKGKGLRKYVACGPSIGRQAGLPQLRRRTRLGCGGQLQVKVPRSPL